MAVDFRMRLAVPSDVLVRGVDAETVLLNLKTESYFGLNEVGTEMWNALTRAASLQAGYETLLAEYEVPPEQLRSDVEAFVEQLRTRGLVEIVGA